MLRTDVKKMRFDRFSADGTVVATAFCALFLALGATVHYGWWHSTVWAHPSVGLRFYILVGVLFLSFLTSLTMGQKWPVILFPLGLLAANGGFGAISSVVWIWMSALCLGRLVADGLRARVPDGHTATIAALGFASLSTAISVLSHFPVNRPVIYFVLLALPVAYRWRYLLSAVSGILVALTNKDGQSSLGERVGVATVMSGVTLCVILTLLPDVGHDALSTHLNIPVRMLESAQWKFDVREYVWAVMPFGVDWLYVPAYFFGGELAARLLNTSFLFSTAVLIFQVVARTGGRSVGLLCAAILLTLPISNLEINTLFIECGLAYFFCVIFVEAVWAESGFPGQWVVLGGLVGFSCAIKLPALLLLPFVLGSAIIAVGNKKFESVSMKSVVPAVAIFIVFCSAPYVVAWYKTGNPVFPFFNQIFKSPYFDSGAAFTNPIYVKNIGVESVWESTLKSEVFGEFGNSGALGLFALVAMPTAFAAALLRRHVVAFAALITLLGYSYLIFRNQAYLRYVFPVVSLALMLLGWSLSLDARRRSVDWLLFTLVIVNVLRWPVGHWTLAPFEVDWAWSAEARDRYFSRSQPAALAGQILAKLKSESGKRIALFGVVPAYAYFPSGTVADVWHSWPFWRAAVGELSLRPRLARASIDIVVFPVGTGWRFEREAIDLSDELFSIDGVRVGRVKPEALFGVETIPVTKPALDIEGWHAQTHRRDNEGVWASVSAPVIRVVDVGGRTSFFLSTSVRCAKSQLFRSQINWLDDKGNIIRPDIAVHQCSGDVASVKRVIRVPDGARSAVVLGSSHDDREVEFLEISLKAPG